MVGERGGRMGAEKREGCVHIARLECAAGAEDEEARAVGRGRRGRRGGDGGGGGGGAGGRGRRRRGAGGVVGVSVRRDDEAVGSDEVEDEGIQRVPVHRGQRVQRRQGRRRVHRRRGGDEGSGGRMRGTPIFLPVGEVPETMKSVEGGVRTCSKFR